MHNNKTIYIGMALALVIGITMMTWWMTRLSQEEQLLVKKPSTTVSATTLAAGGHRIGPAIADVTIVEFIDLQCPYCAEMHPILLSLQRQHPREIAVVVKHFPLEDIHPQALSAAIASECVAESLGEDKFHQYITNILSKQDALEENLLSTEATRLGMTATAFRNCTDEKRFVDKISLHHQQGLSAGVEGTPGLFVNGQLIGGAVTAGDLTKIVMPLLQK